MNKLTLPVFVLGLVSSLFSITVTAADVSEEEMMRLLKLRVPNVDIAPPVKTPLEGVYETRFGNRFGYLIEGGRYIIIGDMIDLQEGRNLTDNSRRVSVVKELATFSLDKMIVFPADGEERAVLNVFTDTSCGYCQQLHKEVKYLQEAGISVRYLPFPRGGSRGPGYANLKKVWCASDKLEAMGIAKGTESGSLDSTACEQSAAVDEGYDLGNRIGVKGTPALFAGNGTQFNGYVPYEQLIPQLVSQ